MQFRNCDTKLHKIFDICKYFAKKISVCCIFLQFVINAKAGNPSAACFCVDGNELKFITVINEYKVIDFLRVFSHIVLQPAV